MALFKILSNMTDTSKSLPTSYNQGYCYFDKTTGRFWIDTVDGDANGRVQINTSLYAVCNTAASEEIKKILIPGLTLTEGTTIYVKFINSNSAKDPSLSVNNGIAYKIMRYGNTQPGIGATASWNGGSVVALTFDGAQWQMQNWLNTDTTYRFINKASTLDWGKISTIASIGGVDITVKMPPNPNNNTTYSLSGQLSGNNFINTLTPSSGDPTTSTIPAMKAATSGAAGAAGLVPAPSQGDQQKFLRADGKWIIPTNTTYPSLSVADMRTGSSNTNSVIRADYLKTFLSTLGGTGLSFSHDATKGIVLNHSNSITAGTIRGIDSQTLDFESTFEIPSITYDAQGHITDTELTTLVLPKNPNTDTKVTSVENHYEPIEDEEEELEASLEIDPTPYEKNVEYTVLTGVKAQRDAKGHITGLTYTAQKIKDTNTTYTLESLNGIGSINTKNTELLKLSAVKTGTTITLTGDIVGGAKNQVLMSDGASAYWGTPITYSASNGIALSGTTFSNSGVRSITINGNQLRANINGTNTDLTIPYATKTDTATKLATGRTIQTKLDSTSAASFDGSANITPGITGTLPIANGGTGATTAANARTNLGLGSFATRNSLAWNEITQSGANSIDEGTSNFTDNTELLTSYASNNGFADTTAPGKVYRRDAVCMYNYVKSKLAITNNTTSVNWNTETTIATIGGTAIKIKIPANPNTNTTYTFANGTDGSFTVTPSGGSAQKVTIGKPATAGVADSANAVAWGNVSGKPSTSISWTDGTTAGPTLTVTAAGSSSSAVAVPTASETASGIVTTGSQIFRGRKGFGYISRYGKKDNGDAVQYIADTYLLNSAGTQVGEFWYDVGNATNITKGQYYFRQFSPNSTADTATTGKYETYTLPNVASGLTENQSYSILTTKDYSAPDGRYVKKAGDTMTGNLLVNGVPSSAEAQIKAGSNAGLIYIYSQNSTTGNRGIYGRNASGTAQSMFTWEQDGTIRAGGALYGAVWNDYAEYRKDNPKEKDIQKPGRCVREVGDGTLALTTKRLERGCEIISDTFGFAIGQDEENGYDTPIASNGRVLAYPYESIKEFANHIGWPVCSGPNGTISIMTEEEEKKYPSRIIGTISEIPTYEEWGSGKVKVDNRIWIRIK